MGRTKALIEIDGVAMADRVADALRHAGCAPVVAYGGDPIELSPLGMRVVPDRYPQSGPVGGVLGLLELFEADQREVFALACDLPALRSRHLVTLIDAADRSPDADVVVARTTSIEPTCAIWRPSGLQRVRAFHRSGGRALHEAIALLRSVEVDVEPEAMRNINTPEELGGYP